MLGPVDEERLLEAGLLLVDACVLVYALRDGEPPEHARLSREVVDSLCRHGRLLVAAPTLAEVARGPQRSRLEAVEGIEVLAFDREAANECARLFPSTAPSFPAGTRASASADRMAVSVASVRKLNGVISADTDWHNAAKVAGLEAFWPWNFAPRQPHLPLPP